MLIFPAIDIIDGCVVRLYQGDYAQKQVFGQDPAAFAAAFEKAGATCLHLVDLDGAKAGRPQNDEIIAKIARQTSLFVEIGGGIRSEAHVASYLDMGVGRVILGTSALNDPAFVRKMAAMYGDKIAVGVDARDGRVAVEGWLKTSEVDSLAFCTEMRDAGVCHIIYTDISRDGAGRGTNLPVYEKLSAIKGLKVTASGGVSSLSEIAQLREMGLYGAILGKALYTGQLSLEQALAEAAQPHGEGSQ